jgi:hypothetical protein
LWECEVTLDPERPPGDHHHRFMRGTPDYELCLECDRQEASHAMWLLSVTRVLRENRG